MTQDTLFGKIQGGTGGAANSTPVPDPNPFNERTG